MRLVVHACLRLLMGLLVAMFLAISALFAYPGLHGLSTARSPDRPTLALRGINVFSPGDPVRQNVTVVARNGRFESIGDAGVPLPPDVTALTHDGLWLIPGLIDAHVHVVDEADMALLLAHGVTTARNMLGRPIHTAMRNAVAAGDLAGPRLLTAGPTLNGRADPGSFHMAVANPETARDAVHATAEADYDLVKVYDGLAPETFEAIVDEAQSRGLAVAGHPPRGVPIERLLAALASIEHVEEVWRTFLRNADDQTIDVMGDAFAESGTPLVATLEAVGRLVDVCGDGDVALQQLDSPRLNPLFRWFGERSLADWVDDTDVAACPRWRGHYERMQEIVLRFHNRGAAIAVGSDSGPHRMVHGETTWMELNRLHDAGLTPAEVLTAATHGSARALRVESDTGAIRPGYHADAVLLRVDPRLAVPTRDDIVGVLAQGRWYDAEALEQLLIRGSEDHADPLLTIGRLLQ